MLKTNFIFCSVSVNRFYRNAVSVIKKLAATRRKNVVTDVLLSCKCMVQNATLPLLKASAVVSIAIAMNLSANAQCNTFQNADAANPLLSVIPKGKTISGLDFADIDGDGLLDCYVRFDRDNKLTLYHNIGTADHAEFIESKRNGFDNDTLPPSTNIYLSANQYMQFVDIDGDGDLDFFITSQNDVFYGYATVMYYKNTGTNKVPHFIEDEAENPAGVAGCYYYVPFKFADIDGDGDYDLYYDYQAQYGYNSGPSVYMNTGTKFSPHFVDYSYTICACNGDGRTYYDWNKDGLLDYFIVNDELDIKPDFYKNIGPKAAPKYVLDNADGPKFKNGSPYRMIDLNNDGAPEVFTATGHYSTLAPVAVIKENKLKNGSKMITVLSSINQSPDYRYKWEYNGNVIPAATHAYLYAARTGAYTLFVTDSCGTGVSLDYVVDNKNSADMIADHNILSLPDIAIATTTAKAFPNPFTSEITIQLPPAKTATASTIKVIDVSGKIWLTQTTTASSLTIGKTLPAGTYLLQVFQGNTIVYKTIMLKQ